ncbi:unnamed protein product [Heligmosomoides polygyrus]|uniref:Aconitase domain-containing protein n=1 Tax=Heligmosomoides polygyrus TaxID=6339 RepID=A0A183FV79_HELPZ|nr:unnamed protein product [Heligmosomoides polygyrus]
MVVESRCPQNPGDVQGIDEVDLLGYGTADDRHVEERHGVPLVPYSRRPEGPAFYVRPGWDMGATLIAAVSLCVENVWIDAMGEPSIRHAIVNLKNLKLRYWLCLGLADSCIEWVRWR